MKSLKMSNNFHGTSVSVRPSLGAKGQLVLSPRQVAGIRKALCGVSGCNCATSDIGTRGGQDWPVSLAVEPLPDGGVEMWEVAKN